MLKRGIHRNALVLMVINSIIGAGIFGLPSKLAALAGVYSIFAFILCAAVIAVYVLCFAEVSSQFTETGGPYLYILKAFGPTAAFFMGWLLLLSRIFNYAVLINLLVTYLSFFFSSFNSIGGRLSTFCVVTFGLTLINYVGVKSAARTSSFTTIAKLLSLAIFIVVGLFFLQPSLLSFSTPSPPVSKFSQAVLLLIFGFGGFESVLVNSGEIAEPQKTLPFALFAGLGIVTLFYCGIQIVSLGTLPSLASSTTPVADAATAFMGKAGGILIVVGAVISIIGTLNVLLLSGSRLPYAFGKEGQFPRLFTYVHPRYATPTVSLAVVAVLCLLVSVAWTFLTALTVAVIIRVLMYAFVCAALIRLRQKQGGKKLPFRVKGGKWIAIAGILLAVWLLSSSNAKELRDVAICLIAGLVVFILNQWSKRKAND